jgi:hypothetical protein
MDQNPSLTTEKLKVSESQNVGKSQVLTHLLLKNSCENHHPMASRGTPPIPRRGTAKT